MEMDYAKLQEATKTIKALAIDIVQKANSGHPGMPMGAVDFIFLLWYNHLRFDPKAPHWIDRDRFVLSAGHGSALLYSLAHLFGYDLCLDDLKQFRQLGSKTPGHPEYDPELGIETTTGPLGQGFANAVGMALGAKMLGARYNTDQHFPFYSRVFVVCGDGDLMEGISSEAGSLAGHLALDNLIALYDDNGITIDGSTDLAFSENVQGRFEAFGWKVYKVDGHDLFALDDLYRTVLLRPRTKPTMIMARTHIGHGSPNKQDTAEVHGSPLGLNEVLLTKKAIAWPHQETFVIPDPVRKMCAERAAQLHENHLTWERKFRDWTAANPDLARQFENWLNKKIPEKPLELLGNLDGSSKDATRKVSAKVLQALAERITNLVGGSADLTPSTLTTVKGGGTIARGSYSGRNIHFGIREHAMGAITNGLALHGGFIPYCSTFLIFSDYMRPAIRLSALMGIQSIFVFTHDSIFLGEDGPTHQPVEQLGALRMIPSLKVFRPFDPLEVGSAWATALKRTDGPTCIVLTRQGVVVPDGGLDHDGIEKGGYIIRHEQKGEADIALIATGSEVDLALKAADELQGVDIRVRVVSMPCREIFDEQNCDYKHHVLGGNRMRKIVVEASNDFGWYRYLDECDLFVGMNSFGASAPDTDLARHFSFTVTALVGEVSKMLGL